MKVGPVQYMIAAAGTGLLVAAVRNQSPVDTLRIALTGSADSARPIRDTTAANRITSGIFAGITPRGDDSIPFSVAAPDNTGNFPDDPPNLASIGQGGHRLRADAAAAFRQWERAYGATIYVSDSYRSYAQQAAAHRRDPNRFATPEGSAHVEARAVDVDLGRTTGGASTTGQAQYDRLVAAGRATGWCNYSGGKPGTDSWHFSWKVCK